MAVKLQFRRDTAANWELNNTILSEGELGLDTTNQRFKIGNGVNGWNEIDNAQYTEKAETFTASTTIVGNQEGIEETFVVTVVNDGTANIFVIDGVQKPTLDFVRGGVYTFDQSDSTNVGHQLAFKDGADNSYTIGVVTTGTLGTSGAQTVITVANDAPDDLRYYCIAHGNYMGNTISVTGGPTDWEEETTGIWEGVYIATKTVQGVLATDTPFIEIDLSTANATNFSDITSDYSLLFRVEVSANNTLKFYAQSAPIKDLDILIKVVR